jgi:hypothetical protein
MENAAKFVEPVTLSPREVVLDVPLMQRLHAEWRRETEGLTETQLILRELRLKVDRHELGVLSSIKHREVANPEGVKMFSEAMREMVDRLEKLAAKDSG